MYIETDKDRERRNREKREKDIEIKNLLSESTGMSPRGNPACRGTFGGRRKAVRDRLALQGVERNIRSRTHA